jgi:hypothetical protein
VTRQIADPMRAALERLLDLAGESAARQILADVARDGARAEFERVVVCRMALRLLEQRTERTEIRDRLISRGVSERTAYRVVSEALGLGPRISANDGGSLAVAQPTLPAPQRMEIGDAEDPG